MKVFTLLWLCLVTSCVGWAQTAGGRIIGSVTDASGAPLSGAVVTVTNEKTGQDRSAKSNGSGEFFLNQLDPSTYTIKASLDKFADTTLKEVTVQVGQEINRTLI